MGNIARHTDLSWELPGLRANVDVPLEDTEFRGHGTPSTVDSGWIHARDLRSWDESAAPPGLEDFQ